LDPQHIPGGVFGIWKVEEENDTGQELLAGSYRLSDRPGLRSLEKSKKEIEVSQENDVTRRKRRRRRS
jgi:hypothetical protein